MASRRKATTPARIAQAEKQRRALDLRKAGMTYAAIAKELGYANEGGAAKVVKAALLNTVQEPADELRRLEAERLDRMQAALWPKAISTSDRGQARAVEVSLGIMERRAKLHGLDAVGLMGERPLVNINLITDANLRRSAADLRRDVAANRAVEPRRLGAAS